LYASSVKVAVSIPLGQWGSSDDVVCKQLCLSESHLNYNHGTEESGITLLTRQNHAVGHHNDAQCLANIGFMYVSESHTSQVRDEQTLRS
jgi:hypothetical protein